MPTNLFECANDNILKISTMGTISETRYQDFLWRIEMVSEKIANVRYHYEKWLAKWNYDDNVNNDDGERTLTVSNDLRRDSSARRVSLAEMCLKNIAHNECRLLFALRTVTELHEWPNLNLCFESYAENIVSFLESHHPTRRVPG